MTSANVTYYYVSDANGKHITEHRQHHLCRPTVRDELSKYPEDYQVYCVWPDEEEEDHVTNTLTIKEYLSGVKFVYQDDCEDEDDEDSRKYRCTWWTEHGAGDLPGEYKTEKDAQAAAEKWMAEMGPGHEAEVVECEVDEEDYEESDWGYEEEI